MANTLKHDELNNLLTEYYDIMDISNEQKLERVELATELFDIFLFLFTYVEAQIQATVSVEIDKETIYEMFDRRYAEACEEYGIDINKHPEIRSHITMVSKEMVDSTLEEREKKKNSIKGVDSSPHNISQTDIPREKNEKKIQERALSVAENESNSVFNRVEYDDAVDSGKYTYKTWITEMDNKVRHTHREVEGMRIPIEEPFIVGDSQMMFAHDSSLGASAEELVNCRCSTLYS